MPNVPDSAGGEAYAEIAAVARRTCESVVTGDYRGGVAGFVDYWNGPGAWNAMRPAAQKALIRWAPKGPLDFRALLDDPTHRSANRAQTGGDHEPDASDQSGRLRSLQRERVIISLPDHQLSLRGRSFLSVRRLRLCSQGWLVATVGGKFMNAYGRHKNV